jgi:hypothetical protein
VIIPAAPPRLFQRPIFRLSLLLLLLALAIAGYVEGKDRTVLEPDVFPFDPSKPFRLQLARGSGYQGQNTVAVSANGYTSMHRLLGACQREHTTTKLTHNQLLAIADAISRHNLPGLNTDYIDGHIKDGTQWSLSILQAGRAKHVYFSNRFTCSIWYFAIDLDDILTWSDPKTLVWAQCDQWDHCSARPSLCDLEKKH